MAYTNPLGGAHLKIIRAHEHLDSLKHHVRLYLDTKPYAFPTQQNLNLVHVGKPVTTVPPHLDIGLIIGDCLGAMMASLDYVAWELASKYAGRVLIPPPSATNDKPSFPLFADPALYVRRNWAGGMRARYKVPAHVLDEVELVQPYHAGYEPLALLYLLVNQDKHRLPVLTIGHVDSGSITLWYGRTAEDIAPAESDIDASRIAFKTSTPISFALPDREVQVNPEVTMFVAFDNPTMPREPVEVTLENILKCAQIVLGRFQRFFV
jgi:hypothetical protein